MCNIMAAMGSSVDGALLAAAGSGDPAAGRVPGRGDAEAAAEALAAETGAAVVLLYGSVATGRAAAGSDVDLCAIHDDLGDYSGRWEFKDRSEDVARRVSGFAANVHVTDRVEWKALRAAASSFERHIGDYAVTLIDRGLCGRVDWDKTLPGPVTDDALAQQRLSQAGFALARLSVSMDTSGLSAASQPDDEFAELLPGFRVDVCSRAQAVITFALSALNHALACPHIPKISLDVAAAVARMPLRDWERDRLSAALGAVSAADVALWRRVCWGDEDLAYEGWVRDKATEGHAAAMASAGWMCAQAAVDVVEARCGETPDTELLKESLQRFAAHLAR